MNKTTKLGVVAVTLAAVSSALFTPGEALASPGGVMRDHRSGHETVARGQRNASTRDQRVTPPSSRPHQSRRPRPPVIERDHRNSRNGQHRVIVRDHSHNGRRGRQRVIVGRGYGRNGRIVIRDHRARDDADKFAMDLFLRHINNLDCQDLGTLLRRVSNDILSAGQLRESSPEEERALPSERRRLLMLKRLMKRSGFTQILWERMTDAYASCDRTCFDDGVAVGILSGTGYCHASVQLDGLPGDDFLYQAPLPVCENSLYVGCQDGYSQAVNDVPGCLTYASGSYAETFAHNVSQDCHIDEE